jgi:hypothetical protein
VQAATRWRVGYGGPTSGYLHHAAGGNPEDGAVIWYQLGKDFRGEVKLEIQDDKGNVIAKAEGKAKREGEAPAEPEKDDEDEDGPPKRKLEPKPGLNRFVWDLTHDGATTIPGAVVDSGGAGARVPVAPGTYTAKLIAAGQTLTQKVVVKPDPRLGFLGFVVIPQSDSADSTLPGTSPLAFQEHLSLRVRDDITKLSDTVARLRAVKKQLALRKDLLKDNAEAKELLKQSEALGKKLDGIEEKLHNPKAKISYDIFAAKGGAMLYSQLAWLLANLTDADGAPTKAQQELAAELEKQLTALVGQFDGVVKGDVAKLNEAAKKLGVPELYVPPVRKHEEANPPAKK